MNFQDGIVIGFTAGSILMTFSAIALYRRDGLVIDGARYRKLRGWMSSNVPEGWQEVERMGALCAWESWETMDGYLDGLPECSVGLMSKPASSAGTGGVRGTSGGQQ